MVLKVLRSQRNDFPQYYKECCLNDLDDIMDPTGPSFKDEVFKLKFLERDILKNGMIHPIIMCNQPKLRLGHQRVWIALKLGYTHISSYLVTNPEEFSMVNIHTFSEEYLTT